MAEAIATDEIYDALTDDALFAALPQRLAESFGGRSALLHWHYADGQAAVLGHSGYFSDAQLGVYAADFARLDPWAAAARHRPANAAIDMDAVIPVERFTLTPFFNDYVRAMGDDTARCMGVVVRNGAGQGMLAIQRGAAQGRFSRRRIAELDALAPHLRRMLTARGHLAASAQRAGALQAMLDALPQAALLVRADGQLIEANAVAVAILDQGVLRLHDGRIAAAHADDALARAIARATDAAAPEGGALTLGRAGPSATIMPARDIHGGRCALLLIEPHKPAADGLARLKMLFGLTDAEAAVAASLAAGRSVAGICADRQTSAATVRTQLRALADKLGCRRQAEIAVAASRILNGG